MLPDFAGVDPEFLEEGVQIHEEGVSFYLIFHKFPHEIEIMGVQVNHPTLFKSAILMGSQTDKDLEHM